MTPQDPLATLKALQLKATQFFEAFAERHHGQMACREGCASCCYVDITVFGAEAQRVLAWLDDLTSSQRQQLRSALLARQQQDEQALTPSRPNPVGEEHQPCAFLINDTCSIYEARPTICRTQGAPLLWRSEDPETTNTRNMDVCPLHPGSRRSDWPDPAEALDLDRLNTLLAWAQHEVDPLGARMGLLDLRILVLKRLGS